MKSQSEPYSDEHRPLYEVKANLFKGLAHPLRIRILEVLSAAPEVAVSDLLAETGLEPSHLSQHLSVLRRHHLVVADRRGSLVYYRLAYPQVADLLAVSRSLLVDILETTRDQLTGSATLPTLQP
ncbi:MAG: metalloregulator ArsR/SmtB family transcription factor [Actinobacteria bacterium]|nr:metalloregulator ArsR/SmtB family transcription factor [Actinomycetota bacterium]